eukprot:TRINITY_DN2168_c0_g4_i1.p1 TRINITY_DN2168_c0_g4~~TRINITY_DN2168_c0_g4_i1.p1  ORF type:complete len:336 (-),score=136.80 TRINITY_DN2168_c0_g4_i1:112-1119(-)
MDKIQVHPTGLVDPKDPLNPTKFLGPEALRASGGILVNQIGKRFVNELGLRDSVTNAIFNNCIPMKLNEENKIGNVISYLVMNSASVQLFQAPVFEFYKKRGFFVEYTNARDLAEKLGFEISTFQNVLINYTLAKENKIKDEFSKTVFPVAFSIEEPLFIGMVTPSIHYTMGGVAIDKNAKVLRKSNLQPIPNLYAAGEVTGGVHGGNRLAGNSLLECVVYARIAAYQATNLNQPLHLKQLQNILKQNNIIIKSKPIERIENAIKSNLIDEKFQSLFPLPIIIPDLIVNLKENQVNEAMKIIEQFNSIIFEQNKIISKVDINIDLTNPIIVLQIQ